MRNQLVRCFDCFGDKFRQKKYIKEHIEAIWTSCLKIRAKIEKKTYLSVRLVHGVRLRSWELVGYVCLSGVRFTAAFYRENLTFPWNSCYIEANPHWILSFPADGSKTSFSSLRQLVVENWEWKLDANLPLFSTGNLKTCQNMLWNTYLRIKYETKRRRRRGGSFPKVLLPFLFYDLIYVKIDSSSKTTHSTIFWKDTEKNQPRSQGFFP